MKPTNNPNVIIASLLLGLLSLVGNWFNIELLFGTKFFFGSIFVLIALRCYGTLAGLSAAVLASSATWGLFHHPWLALALLGEACFMTVALRRSTNIVLIDSIFWLLGGIPFTYLCHRFILGNAIDISTMLALKHGVNGIFNALTAILIIKAARLRHADKNDTDKLPTMHQLLSTAMIAAILAPGICYVVVDLKNDMTRGENQAQAWLMATSRQASSLIDTWFDDKMHDVKTLADMVGDPEAAPRGRIQQTAELVKLAGNNFTIMSVQNSKAVSIAFVPATDPLGHSNVGKDYSRMPYHRLLRDTGQPVVSDIDFGTVNLGPRLALFAPVVINGEFRGYCTGIVDLAKLQQQLQIVSQHSAVEVTLLDRKQQVISSTNPTLHTMERYDPRGKGTVRRLSDQVYQYLPQRSPGASDLFNWQRASFRTDSVISTVLPWTIVVSMPMKPYLQEFYHEASWSFALLLALVVFAIATSHVVMKTMALPIAKLGEATTLLPNQLSTFLDVQWPQTRIREVARLIDNFRQMAGLLSRYFFELKTLNETLEEQVAERTEELRRSEQKFRTIFSDAGIGIVLADPSRRITDCNLAMERILGYPRHELIGRTITELSHPGDDVLNLKLAEQAIAGQRPFLRMEKRYIRKDGSILWGNLTASYIYDAQGAVEFIIGMIEDISERKESEETIRKALEQRVVERTAELESALQHMESFSYSISHDLRTPLRAIDGYTNIIMEDFGPALPAETQPYLNRISGNVRRMGQLIDDLLTYSRLNRQSLTHQTINMADLVQEILDELTGNRNQAELEVHMGDLPPCQADPMLLRQVLINLLNNALKFSQGRTPARLEIGSLRDQGRTVYYVRDNGVGFDMAFYGKLFGVFQRLHPQDLFAGTGVGLAIVQNVIQRHGGEVWAEGKVDEGATFFFTLHGVADIAS